ncbi:uncharacterized protein LOC117172046 [Belonocnema kinseyi]|uniref:uncharacterized protein LOC117172046 n=1 Tax=Belonocnema kinseyi TaxID=2817044 RepID=UPI00143CC179|nr:uncharacterized protein LOC117172046 [Belonocnema kinseyi]
MKKCFLCEKSDNGVTEFDDDSFTKCCQMLAARRQKDHAYGEVEWYRENLNEMGKHPHCYKKIIVLKGKFRDNFAKFRVKLQDSTTASTTKQSSIEAETSSTTHEEDPSLMQDSSLLQKKTLATSSSKSRR